MVHTEAAKSYTSRTRLFVLTLGILAATGSTGAAARAAADSVAPEMAAPLAGVAPSPLLAIDNNRSTVVDRIVSQWGDAFAKANAGLNVELLREMLSAMRADQLLAASLAGSLDGLRNVIATSLVTDAAVKPSLLQAKKLGDLNQDLVYVPVTPCRLVETRGTFAAVYHGDPSPAHGPAPFVAGETRNYTVQGGNGVCLSQLPANVTPSAVQMQVYGMPTTTGSGDIEVLPQGATFGSTASLVYLGNNAFTSSAVTSLVNIANKQISVQVRGGGAHVAMDVVGYFRAPAGVVSALTPLAWYDANGKLVGRHTTQPGETAAVVAMSWGDDLVPVRLQDSPLRLGAAEFPRPSYTVYFSSPNCTGAASFGVGNSPAQGYRRASATVPQPNGLTLYVSVRDPIPVQRLGLSIGHAGGCSNYAGSVETVFDIEGSINLSTQFAEPLYLK